MDWPSLLPQYYVVNITLLPKELTIGVFLFFFLDAVFMPKYKPSFSFLVSK